MDKPRFRSLTAKYRPAYFRDLAGQEAISTALANAVEMGRIYPAYGFHGPRGSGKTSTARILARALNCVSRKTAEPCGECRPCIEISEGRSLDVLEIDAASHTSVDNVREVIIDTVNLAAARDHYRIFIIDEVHMLSPNAFNAMLKTLEEPPAHVVFILATTELAKVPATVISRTQSFTFRALSILEIKARLGKIAQEESIAIEEDALEDLARAAGGSLRDGLSLLEQLSSLAGPAQGAIRRQDLTRLLGLIDQDAAEGIIDALVGLRDFQQARALIQDQLLGQGHSPAQLLSSLHRQTAARLLKEMDLQGHGEQARHLYSLATHVTSLQSSLRSSSDPILSCEVGLLGYLLRQGSPADRAAGPGSAGGAKGSATPAPTPGKESLKEISKANLPKGSPAAVSPAAPSTSLPTPKAPEAMANPTQQFAGFLKALEGESFGFYFEGAALNPQSSPGNHEIGLTNEFCVKGVEKNREKILTLWRTFFGNEPVRFAVRKNQGFMAPPLEPSAPGLPPAAIVPEPPLRRASGDAGPPEAGPPQKAEVPEDLKRMAKVFGGKIKRIRQ